MHQPELRYALALAREAGEAAATATRRIALRNTDPVDPGPRRAQWLGGRAASLPGPAVTSEQVRSACSSIDEFSNRLAEVNSELARLDAAPLDTLAELSAALWAATVTPADAYNTVNDALADLERRRIAALLGRPIDQP